MLVALPRFGKRYTSGMLKWFAACSFVAVGAVAFCQDTSFYPVDETDKAPPSELRERREAVKADLGQDTVGVLFTNPIRNRNNDVDFLFRGDSNFLYLTGFEEPDSALLLIPYGFDIDGRHTTEILFVNESNAMSITWLGYRMGSQNAERLLGVQMALPNRRFSEVMAKLMKPGLKVSIGSEPEAPSGTLKEMIDSFHAAAKDQPAGMRLDRRLMKMREIKSRYEIEMLKKVCDISAKAHVEAMKTIRPNMREWEIASLVQYIFGKMGCEYTGYPPICGSGLNGTILHYESNRRKMLDGELFLMDSAGEYHGYSADVTRTFPVNGKFSSEQRAIYEVVFQAQELGISMCRAGTTFAQISQAISKSLADGLLRLGIIKTASELGRYYMHGFGHGIGLDVHDPAPSTLAAGAALTVEPGIYIKANSPCDKKWWNIGVRIEDDILVTAASPVNMSGAAPRTWQSIEQLMKSVRR